MFFKWYTALVIQDSNNQKAFKRTNGSWIVVDYSCGLCVLDLHNKLKAFDFTSEVTKNISIAEEKNYNAGYLFLRNQEEVDHSLIPLLPGYIEFGSDTSYVNRKAQGFEQVAFYYMLKKYGFVTTNSIQYILSLNIPEIINELKQLVYEKFVIISQVQELENSKLIRAKKKEETLRRSLKRYQEKIDEIIYENNKNRKNIILYGIQIESDGKRLSPKKAQVLMLNNMENKKTIYSQNRTIKTLKEKKLVENEINEKKLGSTIFMSISHYLSILLSLPCSNYHDIIVSNRTFYTTVVGFNLTCIIKCLLCKTSTQYSNEDSDIKYSHLIARATLTGRMNRNSFQTALATIENHMYKPIIESAKQSSKTILLEILDHLKEIYLLKQEKVLPIGFDCSWSYSRNAHQASYNYQPVIAFHTIENSRSVKYDDSSKIVHKENFNGTSRQMEHAILFALLNDIMPILKETILLYIYV
ncbi:hypothetical protein RhiirA1_463710 [Rhizophagus irregularis]|uniref:Uncharacterized protein n=1 Tax=Rhizophagus irregularis TaxID=588596 RepID=A0A2N0RJJ1_9GLOM|nr:hypothetical protein RhiirA1_463710 [Rhizophagus irregularis]